MTYKKAFMALTVTICMAFYVIAPANAQTVITDEGMMMIKGEIVSTSLNTFTIQSNEGTMDVKLDRLNDRSLQNLKSAGILERGNFVEVTGKLEESAIKTVIAAETVSVYNNDASDIGN